MIEDAIALVAERVRAGSRRDLVECLNLVDGSSTADRGRATELLDLLYRMERPDGWVTGVTGAPGVGKSTLVGAVAAELRARGRTVAVLAVDPSSPRTGGALLGDRTRIGADPKDAGLFVRSMASRGALGGLAAAAADAVVVLRAAFDEVVVETVGVGQSEVDVAALSGTTMLVLQPSAGDTLQFMKAGIMEVPDVVALNKSDLPGAHAALAQVRAALGWAAPDSGGWTPAVELVSAAMRSGVDTLVSLLERHRGHLREMGAVATRREGARAAEVRARVLRRGGELAIEALGEEALGRAAAEHPERSPRALAASLEARWLAGLRAG